MFISPAEALIILEHYKYFLIFPIAIIEGPIVIIISGFLVYMGYLNIFVAYPVLVVADTIGDSLYYFIGLSWRKSKWAKNIGSYLGYNEKTEVVLEEHFRKHRIKTFLIAKISHGIGGSIQIAAGMAKVPYKEFILINIIATIPKTLILLTIGFYMGSSYIRIDSYFNYIAMATLGVALLVFLYVFSKKLATGFLSQD